MSQTLSAPATPLSGGCNILAWSLQVLLALVFLAAGGAKLAGAPMMVQIFDQIGLGQGFRIVSGLVEVVGAVALLVPGLAAIAAIWLGITMVGAVLAHILVLPTPVAPALVLLGLAALLAWMRRGQVTTLLARIR